jgi:hypothetical protein
MFETQTDVLAAYEAAGIEVGKVQVSSAVRLRLDDTPDKKRALQQLGSFAEDRYLHQTCVRDTGSNTPTFYEDLPLALKAASAGEWRVHFHVPIYLASFDLLEGTQDDIRECLDAASRLSSVRHFEVETYAWGVLPENLRQPDLAAGIADEMRWFRDLANQSALTK